MQRLSRFVIWICSKFNREQIEFIVKELSNILKNNSDPQIKPKDSFTEKHPNYRDFYVDPNPPLSKKPPSKKKRQQKITKASLIDIKLKLEKNSLRLNATLVS